MALTATAGAASGPEDVDGRTAESNSRAERPLADRAWVRGVLEYFQGQERGALAGLDSFKESLEADPADSERRLFVATLCVLSGRGTEAEAQYRGALAASPAARDVYLELVLFLEARGRREEARLLAAQAIAAAAMWADPWQRPPMFTAGLTSRPWWDRGAFPWAADLEAAYSSIKGEMLELLGSQGGIGGSVKMPREWSKVGEDRAAQDGDIVADGGEWRELVLYGADGTAPDPNVARFFPQTCKLLEALLPSAVAMARIGAGEIILSALAPGTRLVPHCASSNIRLTCHLGLVCPPGARLRVGPDWGSWEEGKCLFFDDSYEHEVVHEGIGVRIVLLIRFWHPDLPAERWLPTLEDGMEQYSRMQRLRTTPPLSPAVLRELASLRGPQPPPAAAVLEGAAPNDNRTPGDAAKLLRKEAADLAVDSPPALTTAVDAAVAADEELF